LPISSALHLFSSAVFLLSGISWPCLKCIDQLPIAYPINGFNSH
jgi:hypothetical protein